MTRTDELFSMNGATLIRLADKLGVKAACNKTRTQLKEKKENVVNRILEAEKKIADAKAEKQIEKVVKTREAKKEVEKTTVSPKVRKDTKQDSKGVVDTIKVEILDRIAKSQATVKLYDKLPNFIVVKLNKKRLFEVRVSKSAVTFNCRLSDVEQLEYHTVNNYYMPATVKISIDENYLEVLTTLLKTTLQNYKDSKKEEK